uniref:Zinc finger protein Elbow n=1 Tax=Drosophila melanogaster TaxID=7227 RepID=ELBOW_DROME|nr:elbow B, isoform D [Drosophila melanogaster]Q9VJS8.4 RecName: Full=Zinc finger protein Elbow [Drosophila melanogaster]AAF53395.4 elbow B, isoform D [Drosophila melanogaster]|eukprot:NP_523566.4 elbow B, isoform D [Drosophila melanogaster]
MLQSSNHHYLRPDYMTAAAAPTAQLDNKSSPLALLAQTCSAIGADTTNPKLLAANIEKSTKQLQHHPKGSSGSGGSGSFGLSQQASMDGSARDKSSPVSSHSSSVSTGSVEQQQLPPAHGSSSSSKPTPTTFKPYEPNNNISNITTAADCGATNLSSNNTSAQQRVKTPKSMTNGGGQRCDSNQSASSQHRESPTAAGSLRRTPTSGLAGGVMQHNGSPGLPPTASTTPGRSNSKESAAMHSPSAAAAAAAAAAQIASSNRLQEAALAAAKEANYVKALHAASQQGSASAAAAAASYYPPGYGSPYSMDLMTASSLMSPHHAMFKASAMNPYLNYARMKGLTEQSMMAATPNVCRDPYCTGCPASPHYINKAAGQPCPAGCPQCEGGGGGGGGSSKSSGSQGGSGGSSSAAAAAAAAAASSYHAQLAALAAASQMPYVCSWIGSDAAYCGKRFGTSDDLFQHLRTHTASVPDAVLSAAAAGGIPPNHPLFQRTYPTPPLSPLSAARYHPYGKPSMLPPSLAPPGMPGLPPHPALAQYFAPYSLYGPRMGSSHP